MINIKGHFFFIFARFAKKIENVSENFSNPRDFGKEEKLLARKFRLARFSIRQMFTLGQARLGT